MGLNSHLLRRIDKPDIRQENPGLFGLITQNRVLLAILLVATILRIGSALYQGNTVAELPGIHDQISYHELAERVAKGYGFSFASGHWPATPANEPTAHWSFLYTLYLAAIYALFGVQPLIARMIQAIVAGILHTWLVWRLGRRIFGPAVGLATAALSAVYIYFFYYAGGLLTETYYILGILWTLDVALRLTADRHTFAPDKTPIGAQGWRLWLEFGLAIGVTVLLRQVFLLFAPFLLLWVWWNMAAPGLGAGRRWSPSIILPWPLLKGYVISILVVAMMIAPWTVRNYKAFGTFVLLNTNAGYAFFWGNHPIYGTQFVGILPPNGPTYVDLIPKELFQLNEAALERALLRLGVGFVIDDPVRIAQLSLSRSLEYFKFWPSSESSTLSNISRVGSFGLCLPLMLYGLWRSVILVRRPQLPQQQSRILLLYLFIAVYTGIHLLTWALIRYRLPVDALLLIFAALGAVDLLTRLRIIAPLPINSVIGAR
jgi:hypothetical protein